MTTTALDAAADLWLLQNDPELAGKSAEYLLNKKIRDTHSVGCQFIDETTEIAADHEEEESQDQEAFFQFVEKQNWLNHQVKILVLGIAQDQSLSSIGQELGGISKQAVHKRLNKHKYTVKYLLKIWQEQGEDINPPPQPGGSISYFIDKNQQLAFDFGGAQ
jgi:hypothetical protein